MINSRQYLRPCTCPLKKLRILLEMKDLAGFDVQVLILIYEILRSLTITVSTHGHQRKLRIYRMDSVDAGDHLRELLIPPVTFFFKKNKIKHITVPHLSMPVINFTLLKIF